MHKKIIVLVAVFLLLVSNADATLTGSIKGLLNTLAGLCDLPLLGKVGAYLGELTSHLTLMLTRALVFSLIYFNIGDEDMFYNNVRESVMNNPSLSPGIENVIGIFISLLQPVYILAIVLTALYLLFMHSSIEGRAKAKSLLFKLIVSLLVISISLPILQASIAVSESLTDTILNLVDLDMIREILHDGMYGSWCLMMKMGLMNSDLVITFYMMLYSVGMWGPYMVIGLRHIMLAFFFMLFPISVVLYSFSLSRGLGRRMIELTIVFLFVQVFMAVTLLAISVGTHINPKEIPGLEVPETSCGLTGISGLDSIVGALGKGRTDILSFTLGVVGHIFFMTAPLIALRWFKGFLP